MDKQLIFSGESAYDNLEQHLKSLGSKNLLLVCGKSLSTLEPGKFFEQISMKKNITVFRFSGFSPNPDYNDILNGIKFFRENKCDAICGAGGGSAMDTAKCIKLFSQMSDDMDYLSQDIIPNDIPFIAIPTTAGSGSEATRFAVIYNNGEKLSVSDYSSIPQAVLLDPGVLDKLPDLHRKSAMLDALSHAIESLWSVNSTEESRGYSRTAIRMIIDNMDGYINHDNNSSPSIMEAAHIAGKAINITTTTAAHAMCYKLTKKYGIPHGHAVSLCLPEVYQYLTENINKCTDKRGISHLKEILEEIPFLLNLNSYDSAFTFLSELPEKIGLSPAPVVDDNEIDILTDSVNIQRLSNTPVIPDRNNIKEMYLHILRRN